MANHSYMSITGNRQGLISAGCSDINSIGNKCQLGHLDEIMVLSYSHNMTTGNDGGVTADRGKHLPIMITKNIDKSTPLLSSAWHEREVLDCTIFLYRTSPSGTQDKYFKIHITGAKIAHINLLVPHAIHLNDAQPQELVSFTYRDISWTHIQAGTCSYSTWGNGDE
ncbi:Hcp family type VI secretion system effector [Pseudomonas serboccidentalis]|uniref:Hcp family type VI secretion system effector n=1 Tax=Pseudomonas serboccidentalis TaxID=2964670 RepID=UPI0039E06BE3